MDPTTFTPDKIASFTRTAGTTQTDLRSSITAITPVAGSNNRTFRISFAATGTTGRYAMVIGPDVRDPFGNQMDQDQNLVPGEIPDDQYTYSFNIGGPQVVSAIPSDSFSVFSLRIGFNVPIDVTTFTPDRIAS
jgi:hypothetical protein